MKFVVSAFISDPIWGGGRERKRKRKRGRRGNCPVRGKNSLESFFLPLWKGPTSGERKRKGRAEAGARKNFIGSLQSDVPRLFRFGTREKLKRGKRKRRETATRKYAKTAR